MSKKIFKFTFLAYLLLVLVGCGVAGPQGEQGEIGLTGNGIASIELTSSIDGVNSYTITYTNGDTYEFNVIDGEDGEQGIQGEPGADGHTPVITIGENGNWFVDNEDSGFKAQGEQGPQGEQGLSAYEIYLKYYPEYVGTEKEWIDDLVAGTLNEKYTIRWANYDGTLLEIDEEVARHDIPEYNGIVPTKPEDVQFKYNFIGWSPLVEKATKDITYVAQFSKDVQIYNVDFYIDENMTSSTSVKYGEKVEIPTEPMKEGHTFAGWYLEDEIYDFNTPITSDTTLVANFIINKYSVIWINYDGTILEEDIDVPYGQIPSYDGNVPEKVGTSQYGYVFDGWNIEVSKITDDTTYIATFTEVKLSDWLMEADESNSYVTLLRYDGTDEEVVMPSEYLGLPVKYFNKEIFTENENIKSVVISSDIILEFCEFQNCTYIEKIVISEGVTSLGDSIFDNCTSLTSVELPTTLTYIGNSVFANCTNLISVVIPENVTYMGNGVFNKCTNLVDVQIYGKITSIGDSAFENCDSLTTFIVPNSVTSVGDNAFGWCDELTEITIPGSVVSLGNYAIWQCEKLTNINLSEGLISIGYYCFDDTAIETIDLPSTLESIGHGAFYSCEFLNSIVIPEKVTVIENSTFSSCYSLKTVILHKNIKEIGSWAFQSCENLEKIVIPESCIEVGYIAFDGCNKLVIYCEHESLPEGFDDEWNPENRPVKWGYSE